jgi:hypothetical protein
MKLKMDNRQLPVKDDIGLLGTRTFGASKSGNSGIVYCNYIPMQLTPEEAEKRNREFRAGKTYARVSFKHPDPYRRGKRGIIWDRKIIDGNQCCLLEIETVNRVSENGFSTLVGVIYPTGYTKIWFPMDVLEKFEEYDEKGELKENEGKGT